MSAILFGSIGTIAETSELQRQAFNTAFARYGLDWHWSQDEYRSLLQKSGGQQRIEAYGRSLGQAVDAAAVHGLKSEIFQTALQTAPLELRAGVGRTIQAAMQRNVRLALVTTTSPQNVASLLTALERRTDIVDFDLVLDASWVERPKPAGDVYRLALEKLAAEPGTCVAVEDNLPGLAAARSAGLACVAFPGENTAQHDFSGAAFYTESLDFEGLQPLLQP